MDNNAPPSLLSNEHIAASRISLLLRPTKRWLNASCQNNGKIREPCSFPSTSGSLYSQPTPVWQNLESLELVASGQQWRYAVATSVTRVGVQAVGGVERVNKLVGRQILGEGWVRV